MREAAGAAPRLSASAGGTSRGRPSGLRARGRRAAHGPGRSGLGLGRRRRGQGAQFRFLTSGRSEGRPPARLPVPMAGERTRRFTRSLLRPGQAAELRHSAATAASGRLQQRVSGERGRGGGPGRLPCPQRGAWHRRCGAGLGARGAPSAPCSLGRRAGNALPAGFESCGLGEPRGSFPGEEARGLLPASPLSQRRAALCASPGLQPALEVSVK